MPTESERRAADALFKRAREEISDIIEDLADLGAYGEESNIEELAGYLADTGAGADQALLTTELTPREPSWVDIREDEDDDDDEDMNDDDGEDSGDEDEEDEDDDNGGDEGGDEGDDSDDDEDDNNDQDDESDDTRPRRSQVRLRRTRVIPVSSTEAIIAFDPPDDAPGQINLTLARMGVDRDSRLRDILNVTEAYSLDGIDGDVSVEGGRMTLTPNSTGRLSLRVVVNEDIERATFRVRAT